MSSTTIGTELTKALRRYFAVGSTTRRNRKGDDLHREMVQALANAATMPGYYSEKTESALRPGFGVALAYDKHVRGYRISGTLAYRINSMTPWQFAALLGQMVDAGVTTTGEGERFFQEMGRAA